MNRRALRFGAVIGATALTVLAIAPAFAATTIVSQATSSALTLSIGGTNAYSGEMTATNDGTKETKTGEASPPVSVLGNQQLVDIGVLVQEAVAKVSGENGTSAACAGAAGNGGSTSPLANVGDSSCITPGDPIGVNLADLDLTDVVTIDPASALGPLAALNAPLAGLLGQITKPLSDALSSALGGTTGLAGGLGAVEARCTAVPGSASGTANIVDGKLTLSVMGKDINLLTLPVNPAPNTDLLVNLDDVLPAILAGLTASLDQTLADLGSDPVLGAILDPLTAQIKTALLTPIADNLGPALSDNILKVTLNKQVKTGNDKIEVTALDLQLLPAAAQFGISSLLGVTIGDVSCGPNAKVATTPTPTPAPAPGPITPPNGPSNGPGDIPSSVDAGMGGNSNATVILGGTAALLLLAGSAGLIGYRRMLLK